METYGDGERLTRFVLDDGDVGTFLSAIFRALHKSRHTTGVQWNSERVLLIEDISIDEIDRSRRQLSDIYQKVKEGKRQFTGTEAHAAYTGFVAGAKEMVRREYPELPEVESVIMTAIMARITNHEPNLVANFYAEVARVVAQSKKQCADEIVTTSTVHIEEGVASLALSTSLAASAMQRLEAAGLHDVAAPLYGAAEIAEYIQVAATTAVAECDQYLAETL